MRSGPVDAARSRLDDIDQLNTLEQVEAFDAVHRHLQDALAAVEQDLRGTGGPVNSPAHHNAGQGRR